jgi:hypothetical protein
VTRLLVPIILAALLAAQIVSLFQAHRRSQVTIVEVVYRGPSAAFAEALDIASMAQLLDGAVRRSKARQGELLATFELTTNRVIVRFSLLEGDANEVARDFAKVITTLGFRSMLDKMSQALAGTAAIGCSACLAKAASQSPSPADAAIGARFVVERLEERRSPWIRPLDVLAVALYLVALAVWLPRRSRSAPAQPPK